MGELTQNVASTCPTYIRGSGPNPHVTKGNLMISRYSRPDMVQIWSPESKFRICTRLKPMSMRWPTGVIPRETQMLFGKQKTLNLMWPVLMRLRPSQDTTIAFLNHLAEHVGLEEARFVHQGMTSSALEHVSTSNLCVSTFCLGYGSTWRL